MILPPSIDPLKIVWRSGKDGDEYVDKSDVKTITQNYITLDEIPWAFQGVEIDGYIEVKPNAANQHYMPASNEYIVDYTSNTGRVYFNPSENGKSVASIYKGMGIILYPASRVYVESTNSDSTQTLQDFVDETKAEIDRVDADLTTLENEMNDILLKADYDTDRDGVVDHANESNFVNGRNVDDTVTSTNNLWTAQKVSDELATKSDIGHTHTKSEITDFVETDYVHQNVAETITGAKSFAEDVQVQNVPFSQVDLNAREKILYFVSTAPVYSNGVQKAILQFPYDGLLESVTASVSIAGITQTILKIEKCSETDYEGTQNWINVFSTNLTIDANKLSSKHSATQYVIANSNVSAGDYFRINLAQVGNGIQCLNVQLKIKKLY